MPIVPFQEMMQAARAGGYAVGYFECWSLESLLAVADAAEEMKSPVLLGFSGIYLPHPERLRTDALSIYAAMGLQVCRNLSVPACLVFNESPDLDWVMEAIRLGFGLVMFSNPNLAPEEQVRIIRRVVKAAHQEGVAVEGEAEAIPGMGGGLRYTPEDRRLTEVSTAQQFVEQTGVDAFAVNLGQVHLHGRERVHLDLERLSQLRAILDVPLVLHGASSVDRDDLQSAIQVGICKINVGSILKQEFFRHLRYACMANLPGYNPYEVIGSGLRVDVLMEARRVVQGEVTYLMRLFGSAGIDKGLIH